MEGNINLNIFLLILLQLILWLMQLMLYLCFDEAHEANLFQPRFGLISTLLQPSVLFQPLIPCSHTLVFYTIPKLLSPLLQNHMTFHLKCHTKAGAGQWKHISELKIYNTMLAYIGKFQSDPTILGTKTYSHTCPTNFSPLLQNQMTFHLKCHTWAGADQNLWLIIPCSHTLVYSSPTR